MPSERYRDVPLTKLRLDPQNPRLPMGEDWESLPEGRLLKEIYHRYNLVELARSIVDKGFTPRHAEALLVVEEPPGSKSFVVVEGNRRLATLMLLSSRKNRQLAGATGATWQELADKAASIDIAKIPVIVYQDRGELNDYLGFRHITGPSPWRPEAKARFIAKLLQDGASVSDVARGIGSNNRTVRRYAEAFAIYKQAMDAQMPLERVEAGFGVFYNALDWEGMRVFLRLGSQAEIERLPEDPVPVEQLGNLRDLLGLLYGDESRVLTRVIGESRDLSKLSRVLLDERARTNLLRDRDLERAWRSSGGGKWILMGLLSDVHSKMAEVNGQANEYKSDPEVRDEVRRVSKLAADTAERYEVESN